MGNLLINTLSPGKIFLGTNNVQKIMCGEEQCWPPLIPWNIDVVIYYYYCYEATSSTSNLMRKSWWYIPGSNLLDAWNRYDATGMDTHVRAYMPLDDNKVLHASTPYEVDLYLAPRHAGDAPPYKGVGEPIDGDIMFIKLKVGGKTFSSNRWLDEDTYKDGWLAGPAYPEGTYGMYSSDFDYAKPDGSGDVEFRADHATWCFDRSWYVLDGHAKTTYGSPFNEGEFKVLEGYIPSTFWDEIIARDPDGFIRTRYNSWKNPDLRSLDMFSMKQLAALAPYNKSLSGTHAMSDGTYTRYTITPTMDGSVSISYYNDDVYPEKRVTKVLTASMFMACTSTKPYFDLTCYF